MGVKGLNNFIIRFEKCIMDRIDMREEIENWKLDHPEKLPQILIDLKEAQHIFVQRDEIGVILGGRFDLYNTLLRNFLENLRKTNAKLVFFFPGKKYTDDLQFFIPKREGDYMSHLTVMDKIDGKCNLHEFLMEKNKHSVDIRMSLSFEYNLKKLIRRYGDFHVTYVRHNQEIARYANEHADEVLAVISNDTDFMAFEGDFEYWRANGINIKQLSGVRYSKPKLHETIELNVHQMQLLSALCGSNFLPFYVIKDWIAELIKSNPEQRGKIRNVAKYVQQQSYEMIKGKPKFDLEAISRDVFGPDCTPEQMNSIANGLACYYLQFDNEANDGMNSFVHFCKKHDSFMYKLITDDIFNIKDIDYIDYRNYKSKTYAELIIPILMKLCGILCRTYARHPIVRKICMKHAHDEPFKVTEETIFYPPMKLPDPFDLVFKNKERIFDKYRWELLEWILDFGDGFVKKLQEKKNSQFSAIILTLKYLIQQGEFTIREANAILYTEHKVRDLKSHHVQYPQHANTHFIRIAHLYVKMYVLISHSLDICGLHEMTDLIRFDGPIFHQNMDKFEIANEQQMRVLLSTIEAIWTF